MKGLQHLLTYVFTVERHQDVDAPACPEDEETDDDDDLPPPAALGPHVRDHHLKLGHNIAPGGASGRGGARTLACLSAGLRLYNK